LAVDDRKPRLTGKGDSRRRGISAAGGWAMNAGYFKPREKYALIGRAKGEMFRRSGREPAPRQFCAFGFLYRSGVASTRRDA
jgi:hypothetical protein